jgi:hypothetical protein
VDIRKEVIQAIDEAPKIPDKVETSKQTIPARRADVKTIQGDVNLDGAKRFKSYDRGPVNADTASGIGSGQQGTPGGTGQAPPPPPPPPPPKKADPTDSPDPEDYQTCFRRRSER